MTRTTLHDGTRRMSACRSRFNEDTTMTRTMTQDTIATNNAAIVEAAPARLASLRAALGSIKSATVDAIVDTRAVTAEANQMVGTGDVLDNLVLVAQTPRGAMRLRLNKLAHDQLAQRTEIPLDYWRRMLTSQPDLAAMNVNRWLHTEPAKRLVRMLAPLTEQDKARAEQTSTHFMVRAVLGSTYRPLDNVDLLESALEPAARHGALLTDYDLDERRFFARFTTTGRDVLAQFQQTGQGLAYDDMKAAREAAGFRVGEMVRAGFMLRNSEVGHAALEIAPFAEVIRCLNGLIVNEAMRRAHVGKRASEEEDNAWMQTDTRRLDDAALFLKVRDKAEEVLSEAMQRRIASQIADAAGTPLALPTGLPMFEWVGNVGAKFDLNQREVAVLQEEVAHEVATGPTQMMTKWSISQGMTALARRMGDEGDYDRRVELERAGWTVLTDATAKLIAAGEASKGKRKN